LLKIEISNIMFFMGRETFYLSPSLFVFFPIPFQEAKAMFATPELQEAIITDLLAGDESFGGGTMNVMLSKSTFDPMTCEGFEEADFDGYAAKTSASWANGEDPTTGNKMLTLLPPVGGFRFVAGANITEPQNIHGYVVKQNAEDYIMAGALFDTPVAMSEPGQQLNLGPVTTQLSQDGFI